MASSFQENIYDYSDEAIARRTLGSLSEDPEIGDEIFKDSPTALLTLERLYQDPQLRPIMLDTLWLNTRERALFLFNRLCCVINGKRIGDLLEELERLTRADDFISTGGTPMPEIEDCLRRLLEAMGTELTITPPGEAEKSGAAEEAWEYHEVIADMRASRLAGTGKGGETLSPLEDGIRRLKVILIAANHLNTTKTEGAPVHISGDLGRAEVLAIREYTDRLADRNASAPSA